MGILYVSDLDGTLLNTSASLSPYTIKTINGLVEKRMLFTYATARSLSSASVAAKGLNPKIPVIVYNGAYIMEPATGNILASESFTKEERSYVERKLSGYGVSPVVYSFIKGRECVSWNLLQINEGKKRYFGNRQGDKRLRPVENEKKLYECAILIRKHCRAREKRYSLRLCRFFHLCRVSKTFEISRIPMPL